MNSYGVATPGGISNESYLIRAITDPRRNELNTPYLYYVICGCVAHDCILCDYING